jgi:hypothetical protein
MLTAYGNKATMGECLLKPSPSAERGTNGPLVRSARNAPVNAPLLATTRSETKSTSPETRSGAATTSQRPRTMTQMGTSSAPAGIFASPEHLARYAALRRYEKPLEESAARDTRAIPASVNALRVLANIRKYGERKIARPKTQRRSDATISSQLWGSIQTIPSGIVNGSSRILDACANFTRAVALLKRTRSDRTRKQNGKRLSPSNAGFALRVARKSVSRKTTLLRSPKAEAITLSTFKACADLAIRARALLLPSACNSACMTA